MAVNPDDTEEAIWAFLSEKKLGQCVAKPLMRVGHDDRAVMRSAYALFESSKADLQSAIAALAAYTDTPSNSSSVDSENDSFKDEFYAHLYLGLYAEAHGDAGTARTHMCAAVQSPYGKRSSDYMTAVARMHMHVRGWTK